MDFDIGNLIYIIAMLVAVLVGIFGKKKKSGTGNKGNIFEKLGKELEGFAGVNQQDAPGTLDYETVEEEKEEENEGILNPELQKHRGLIQTEGIRTTDSPGVFELEQEEEGQDFFEIIRDFDLGTAVIYSAIINRIEY